MPPGVHVTSIPALLIAALILGLVNAAVRPILVLLTPPITVLTLGFVLSHRQRHRICPGRGIVPGFYRRPTGVKTARSPKIF